MNSEKVFIVFLSLVVYMNCEKYVLGNNSCKISILIYMNSEKYVYFDNNTLKISVLVYMNSEEYT